MPEEDRRNYGTRPFQSKSQEANVTEAAVQDQAGDDWAAALAEQGAAETPAAPVFQKLAPGGAPEAKNDIDLILDIPVQLTVELGRTKITIKNLLQLAQGSVVELDGLAGEPMDVLVNGCLIAQGEVVVVNDKFGIRLTDIVTPSERMRQLNR
jgi:flagellar motor switch protein FliN